MPYTYAIIKKKLAMVDDLTVLTAALRLREGLEEVLRWFVRFISKRLAFRDRGTNELKLDSTMLYEATLENQQRDLKRFAAWPTEAHVPFGKSMFGHKQELLKELLRVVDAPAHTTAKFVTFFKEIYEMLPTKEEHAEEGGATRLRGSVSVERAVKLDTELDRMKRELNKLVADAEKLNPMPKVIIQALRMLRDTELEQLAGSKDADPRRHIFRTARRLDGAAKDETHLVSAGPHRGPRAPTARSSTRPSGPSRRGRASRLLRRRARYLITPSPPQPS